MGGLWRNEEGKRGGKYLVVRRNGSIPEWPWFVLGARDPSAPAALIAYAKDCDLRGVSAQYVTDVMALAEQFERYAAEHGYGDPTSPPEEKDKDNPAIVSALATAGTGETKYRLIAEGLWHLLHRVEIATTAAAMEEKPHEHLKNVQRLAHQRVEFLVGSPSDKTILVPVEKT
jgi:hypothetical protein